VGVVHPPETVTAVPVACTPSGLSPAVTLAAANAPEAKYSPAATAVIIVPSLKNGFLENID
jgi:hypothetical protein